MSLLYQNILNIRVVTNSKKQILEYIQKYLESASKSSRVVSKNQLKTLHICTPNPEQVMLARHDSLFQKILNQAVVTVPDGIGIVWAGRVLPAGEDGSRVRARYPGVECMQDVVALSEKKGVRIGLIGGSEGVAVKTLECLQSMHPKLKGWAQQGPQFSVDESADLLPMSGHRVETKTLKQAVSASVPAWSSRDIRYLASYFDDVIQKIIATRTRVVFIAMGAPKQEYVASYIARRYEDMGGRGPLVCMVVGGSFDIISSMIQRAPLLIRSVGMEWVYRLVREPWRWRRQRALIQFVRAVYDARK